MPTLQTDELFSVATVRRVLPTVARGAWREVDPPLPGQVAFLNRPARLSALLSAAPKADGRVWLHFSIAHRDRLPTWDELTRAKDLFLGPETKAVQVFAPRSLWVNIHPFALHLWACLDGDPLPDFTDGLGSI